MSGRVGYWSLTVVWEGQYTGAGLLSGRVSILELDCCLGGLVLELDCCLGGLVLELDCCLGGLVLELDCCLGGSVLELDCCLGGSVLELDYCVEEKEKGRHGLGHQ